MDAYDVSMSHSNTEMWLVISIYWKEKRAV